MSWTARRDTDPCCGDEPGAVLSRESVARLVHSRVEIPEAALFRRDELTWNEAKFGPPNNTCGDADGCSVDRCGNLTRSDILGRADDQANKHPGRVGRGAFIASVERLRAISHEAVNQAVFVYDDPKPENREPGCSNGGQAPAPPCPAFRSARRRQ